MKFEVIGNQFVKDGENIKIISSVILMLTCFCGVSFIKEKINFINKFVMLNAKFYGIIKLKKVFFSQV